MKADLLRYRQLLAPYMVTFLKQEQQRLHQKGYDWADDVFERLVTFVPSGKLLRGSAVLLMTELFDGKPETALPVAAAAELMQSAVLIHDDIIDKDPLRRDAPSIYTQYEQLAHQKKLTNPTHLGISFGICVGDIGIFLGYNLLSQLKLQPTTQQQVMGLISQEFTAVGLAEMYDVALNVSPEPVTREQILKLHLQKTGRYTMALPLQLGAVVGGADQKTITSLHALGEVLGTVFQLRDDELGLFGTAAVIGKSEGSDVREGKKTLYYLYALEKATAAQRERLQHLFGKSDLTLAELAEVRDAVTRSGAQMEVEREVTLLEHQVAELLEQLSLSPPQKQRLAAFIELVSHRSK